MLPLSFPLSSSSSPSPSFPVKSFEKVGVLYLMCGRRAPQQWASKQDAGSSFRVAGWPVGCVKRQRYMGTEEWARVKV